MIGASTLERARARMMARMTEAVRVGPAVDGFDPETGDPTVEITAPLYGGDSGAPGQIKYVADSVSESGGTGDTVAVQRPILKVPHGTTLLPEGDAVYVVSSTADDILAGRWYRIAGTPDAGQTSAHRYPLTEIS